MSAEPAKLTAAQLINQDSGDYEYYSPQTIVDAARLVMGEIDLDPFSSDAANRRVRAARYFTVKDNGLVQDWHGRVWMNHPFSRILNPLCIDKLDHEFRIGHTTEACAICYAATSEAWFRPLLMRPQCYLTPRTNYYLPDGSLKRGVTKGSVVTYFGPNVDRFAEVFHSFGIVKIAVTRNVRPLELAVDF